jgi:hypothetical protein
MGTDCFEEFSQFPGNEIWLVVCPDTGQERYLCPTLRRLTHCYFLGLRFACARSDAMGPRSRLGVLGLRKSFPACDASLREVVISFLLFALVGSLWLTGGCQRL